MNKGRHCYRPSGRGRSPRDGGSSELAALGQTPSLAARLQGEARPNEVVISEVICRLAGSMFEVEATDSLELKGFDGRGQAFRVQGAEPAASPWEKLNRGNLRPLVGRAVELALVQDRWNKAASGAGQVVVISAEPGVGKSRLVQKFRGTLASGAHMAVPL